MSLRETLVLVIFWSIRIWTYLPKKSLIENFDFLCSVRYCYPNFILYRTLSHLWVPWKTTERKAVCDLESNTDNENTYPLGDFRNINTRFPLQLLLFRSLLPKRYASQWIFCKVGKFVKTNWTVFTWVCIIITW